MEFTINTKCTCDPSSVGVHAMNCPMSWMANTTACAAAPTFVPFQPATVPMAFGPLRLADEDVERIAKRVVELLREAESR